MCGSTCVLWMFFLIEFFLLVRLECVEQNTSVSQSNWFACRRFIDDSHHDDDGDSDGGEHRLKLNSLKKEKYQSHHRYVMNGGLLSSSNSTELYFPNV